MLEYSRMVRQKMTWLTRTLGIVLALFLVALVLAQTVFAKSTYLINDGDTLLLHTTFRTNPADILSEAGLALGAEDTYTTQNGKGVSEIIVQRKQSITVYHGSQIMTVNSYGETVDSLLKRLSIILRKDDVVSQPLNKLTYDGMILTISQSVETEETYTKVLPYETVYCYDASLKEGEEVVLTPGVNGQLLCTSTVHYVDGKEVNRVVTSEVVINQPVNAVVAIGSYVDISAPVPMPEDTNPSTWPTEGEGYIVTSTGETLRYTQKLIATGTAYYCPGGNGGITYTGTPARVGAIAVDPTVIPLNSRLYIVTCDGEVIYGLCTAEDIGGHVKGAWVDLYYETYEECCQFGMRDCIVYILG